MNDNIIVMRAEEEWQRAGAYSVRIQGMNRQHHIPLREEFDGHDCDGTKYIVLLDEGYPFATCRFYDMGNGKAVLGRVVVLPEYRGHGYGAMVISEAEKWAAEQGFAAFEIDSKTEAVEFYKKLGFVCDDDRIVKSGCFDCIHMSKAIPPCRTDLN